MKLLKSKLGLIFVLIYAIYWIKSFFIDAASCASKTSDAMCGLYKIFPALPGMAVFIPIVQMISNLGKIQDVVFWIFYSISLLINILLLYFIGFGIQQIFNKIKNL
jgi:hypothetical protein